MSEPGSRQVTGEDKHKHFFKASICHSEHLLQSLIVSQAWTDSRIPEDRNTFEEQRTL